MSITKLFTGLSGKKKQAQIYSAEFDRIFQMNDPQYDLHENSGLHGVTRYIVGTADTLRGPHSGPTKLFFTDPLKREMTEEDSGPFSDPPNVPLYAPLSSGIICAAHQNWNKKAEQALVIRKDVKDITEYPFVFAIHTIQESDNALTIKKIMLPIFDKNGNFKDLKKMPLTKENITRALAYAELCVEQLMDGGTFTPEDNLFCSGLSKDKKQQNIWEKRLKP